MRITSGAVQVGDVLTRYNTLEAVQIASGDRRETHRRQQRGCASTNIHQSVPQFLFYAFRILCFAPVIPAQVTMKPNWQFPFVLLSLLATVSSLQEWDEKHSIGSSNFVGRSGQLFNGTVQYSDRRIGNQLSDTERNDTIIIHRCQAQEFSPGAALGVMIVLATGSVLQMPGSLLSRKSSLYRLAPELGILELIP